MLFAAMLLSGHAMPGANVSVEPQSVMVPVSAQELEMTSETLSILINQHIAPHWNLTPSLAWELYEDGAIVITEIEPEYEYRVTYGGGIMVVVLEGSGI
ncbi:MAG: hypothetical protein U0176_15355 [Bacteroidia bacterium]